MTRRMSDLAKPASLQRDGAATKKQRALPTPKSVSAADAVISVSATGDAVVATAAAAPLETEKVVPGDGSMMDLIITRGLREILQKDKQKQHQQQHLARRAGQSKTSPGGSKKSKVKKGRGVGEAPSFVTCYLCGQQFGRASIDFHRPQCYLKAMIAWERGNVQTRGPKPEDPEAHKRRLSELMARQVAAQGSQGALPGSWHADVYNDLESSSYAQNLSPCPHCARTFRPDRLEVHLRSCKPGTAKPVAVRSALKSTAQQKGGSAESVQAPKVHSSSSPTADAVEDSAASATYFLASAKRASAAGRSSVSGNADAAAAISAVSESELQMRAWKMQAMQEYREKKNARSKNTKQQPLQDQDIATQETATRVAAVAGDDDGDVVVCVTMQVSDEEVDSADEDTGGHAGEEGGTAARRRGKDAAMEAEDSSKAKNEKEAVRAAAELPVGTGTQLTDTMSHSTATNNAMPADENVIHDSACDAKSVHGATSNDAGGRVHEQGRRSETVCVMHAKGATSGQRRQSSLIVDGVGQSDEEAKKQRYVNAEAEGFTATEHDCIAEVRTSSLAANTKPAGVDSERQKSPVDNDGNGNGSDKEMVNNATDRNNDSNHDADDDAFVDAKVGTVLSSTSAALVTAAETLARSRSSSNVSDRVGRDARSHGEVGRTTVDRISGMDAEMHRAMRPDIVDMSRHEQHTAVPGVAAGAIARLSTAVAKEAREENKNKHGSHNVGSHTRQRSDATEVFGNDCDHSTQGGTGEEAGEDGSRIAGEGGTRKILLNNVSHFQQVGSRFRDSLKSQSSTLAQCPHCGNKFNPARIQKHVTHCSATTTGATPPTTGKRSSVSAASERQPSDASPRAESLKASASKPVSASEARRRSTSFSSSAATQSEPRCYTPHATSSARAVRADASATNRRGSKAASVVRPSLGRASQEAQQQRRESQSHSAARDSAELTAAVQFCGDCGIRLLRPAQRFCAACGAKVCD